MPDSLELYSPAQNVAGRATAADLAGARFVAPNASKADGSPLTIGYAAAGAKAFGVLQRDAKQNGVPQTILRHGNVTPVTCDGAVTFGTEVEVGTAGRAKTLASGRPVGYAISSASDGATAFIAIY